MAAILAVDDSASIRQTVTITLELAGHKVDQATNGKEGLTKAEASSFDLIITDLNMPNMDGLMMIRELRKNPAHAGVPILFLTTESDAGVKQQAKSAGATGWVTKPFSPEQLTKVVEKVLAR